MIAIEKILNGYIVLFKNQENREMKLHFATYEEMEKWIKQQFEPVKPQ